MLKKLSLLFLILRGCSPSYAQVAINDTIVIPLATVSPIVNHKATLDLNPVISASPVVVNQGVAIKGASDTGKINMSQIQILSNQISAVKGTADSARTTNQQQATSIATISNITLPAVSNTASRADVNATIANGRVDSIISKWPSGAGWTPPPIYNVTASQNIPALPYGTEISVKCPVKCTLTFNVIPVSPLKYTIHNIGTTTVSFSATSLNQVNFLSSLAAKQRPLQITYFTPNTIEIH